MQPVDYLKAIKRRWWIPALCALVFGALAYIVAPVVSPAPSKPASTTPKSYGATAKLLLGNPGAVLNGSIFINQLPLIISSGEVPKRVASAVGYTGDPSALSQQVTVNIDKDNGILSISTVQKDADLAEKVANGFGDETIKYLQETQQKQAADKQASLLKTVSDLQVQLTKLDNQLATDPNNSVLRAQRDVAFRSYSANYELYQNALNSASQASSGAVGLTVLDRAVAQAGQAPAPPPAPIPALELAAIGAAAGLALGLVIVLLLERFNKRIRDRRRAEEAFQAPVIAELSTLTRSQRGPEVLVSPRAMGGIAEEFRTLRASLAFLAGASPASGDGVGVIVIASAVPGDGKTTTTANIAAAFAETGRSVVLVNADFRKAAIAKFVMGNNKVQLAVTDLASLNPSNALVPTLVSGLKLLDLTTLGNPPGDLARATARLIDELRQTTDVIVVDTPPLSLTAEALEFIPRSTVTVLVARAGHTPPAAASRATELVRFGGAQQVGVVLVGVGKPSSKRKYYEYYRGTSGAGRLDAPSRTSAPLPDRPAAANGSGAAGDPVPVLPPSDAATSS